MDEIDRMLTWCFWGFLALCAAMVGCLVYISRSYARAQAVICPAQELELAPGVTLMWALQCFFGGGSRWRASRGLAYVESGFWSENKEDGFVNGIELVLCVDPRTGRIEIVSSRLEGGYSVESLIDALVRAASEQ